MLSFSQFCLPNGIIFSRQSQVDSFPLSYPGCILIEGDLHIEGDDIVNIDSLYPIIAAKGNFLITYNPYLANLKGLLSLRTIEGSLSIIQNPKLKSLHGLTSLESVQGDFLIHDNDGLIDLNGADRFQVALGDLLISGNDSLVHPLGLKLDSIKGTLILEENAILQDLRGFDSLTFIGGDLLIMNNSKLGSLSGIDSFNSLGDHLEIIDNEVLENIDALAGLKNGAWNYLIIENSSLLSHCNITSICNYLAAGGDASIGNNDAGCNSIEEVEMACTVDVKNPSEDAGIIIYPNPTSQSIEIFGVRNSNFSCTLHNIHGQFIHQWNKNESQLDLYGIETGVYVLTIKWKDRLANKQVIKY